MAITTEDNGVVSMFFRSKQDKEIAILWCLDREPGGLLAIEIERITGIMPGSLYPLLDALKRRGMVCDVALTGVPPRRYKWQRTSDKAKDAP